jgi:hypothetical protein
MTRTLMTHVKYAWYVLRHKWFVFVACWRLGIPVRGLLHDLSKLRPSEWVLYARYFYADGGRGSRTKYLAAFDLAWLKHQHRNPHHWQYWLLQEDDGPQVRLRMPQAYVREPYLAP